MNPSEAQIKRACYDLLQPYENQGKLIYQPNNSFCGRIQRPNGSSGWIKNNKPGMADIMVYLPKGRTLHVELKSKTGKQSPDQITYQRNIEKLGHIYLLINDPDQLIKAIGEYV